VLIIVAKSFSQQYICYGQMTDNDTIVAYGIAVAHQKIVYSIGLIVSVGERKFQGTKVPGDECFRECISFPGTNVLGYKSSSYRSFLCSC